MVRDGRRARLAANRSAWFAAWWVGLWALWLLVVWEWSWVNAVVGAGLALLGAIVARVAARLKPVRACFRWRWLSDVPGAALATAIDVGVLAWVLLCALRAGRREIGDFRHDAGTAGADELATGRRAWATLLATWSANSYVVHTDRDTGRRLLHDLVPRRQSERPT